MISARVAEEELIKSVKSVKEFGDRVFSVFDPEVLYATVKKLKRKPLAGIVYEGLTGSNESGDFGKSSFLSFGIVIIADERVRDEKQTADKAVITSLCDSLRGVILGMRSATGHAWEFVAEVPITTKENDALLYYQMWRLGVIV